MTARERRLRKLETLSSPRMCSAMFMLTDVPAARDGPMQAGQRRVVDYEEDIPGLVQWRYRLTTDLADNGNNRMVPDGYMARRLSSAAARSCHLPWDDARSATSFIYSVTWSADEHRREAKQVER